MNSIIIALAFQILLVVPVYLAASSLRKSSSNPRKFFATSYVLYAVWCVIISAVLFFVPFLSIFFGLYFLLIPIIPVAMIIGIGVLHWSLSGFSDNVEKGEKRISFISILILIVISLLLLYLYGRANPQSIPVPSYIQQQKIDFETQIKESGGAMNP